MQVLLINPSKKRKTKKRGAAMAKKKRKLKRRKTAARKNPSTPRRRRRAIRRRKVRVRRNPSVNPIIAYTIGGFSGIATSAVIDSLKEIHLPMGITAGNIASIGAGYLMYKKGTGAVKQIGTAHLASAIGWTAVKMLNHLTGNRLAQGLQGGFENYPQLVEITEPHVLEEEEIPEFSYEPEVQFLN
jgi:hypothetical protein